MHFLTDQDVYQITVEWLKEAGHDVVTARDLEMERATDRELLERSQAMKHLLVTRDKDFGTLIFLGEYDTAGAILLRMLPIYIDEVHSEFQRLLQEHTEDELQQLFCVVEPHRYRIRKLPES